jgi:alanine-glyoxylate transaminase/serine-glyoxylate transaminase/serine-pyruvate transaminase
VSESATSLPATERLLLGPGPSPVSPRVLAALHAAPRSHLDPELMGLLDDIRARLARVFNAPAGSLTLAVSGTGTAAMEAAVANTVAPGRRALAVVNGYFGDRLADMLARYGAEVERVDGPWGRAADVDAVARALAARRVDVVTLVHGETSTGVVNPAAEIARLARAGGALTIVDAVTSLGAVPVDVGGWGVDVCYSCSQKGLGAPSGLSPITFGPEALARRVGCRSFYLDLALLEDYWLRRRYHHTIPAPLVYALHAALGEVDEEGLDSRWHRHADVHRAFVEALGGIGLSLLPPEPERLRSLNAVRVPDGVDEARVRRRLLDRHGIEIGAGLGPLSGRIWRVGLMGSGSTVANAERAAAALADALAREADAG